MKRITLETLYPKALEFIQNGNNEDRKLIPLLSAESPDFDLVLSVLKKLKNDPNINFQNSLGATFFNIKNNDKSQIGPVLQNIYNEGLVEISKTDLNEALKNTEFKGCIAYSYLHHPRQQKMIYYSRLSHSAVADLSFSEASYYLTSMPLFWYNQIIMLHKKH